MESVELYNLEISIDTNSKTFKGVEKVTGIANGPIVLDSAGLTISSLKVNGKDTKFDLDVKDQKLKVSGKHDGKIELDIVFSGNVSDSLNGIYYSETKNGPFFSTQFEATGARYTFPCIDNPAYKAEFAITLDIPRDFDAISNMPEERITENGGRKTIKFLKTPRMSTYLVYVGAGHYDIGRGEYDGKPVYLVTAKGNMKDSKIPIDMAKGSLKFFEEYFGIKYQLPKLHLIAVPEFAFGAMENWGAITFREVLLNLDKSSSASAIKSADEVIAHELAHQWFGNLVTMRWWNDLWLNESFATFMSFKSVDARHKEWNVFDDFVMSQTSGALHGDSLRKTHPIEVNVTNPNEIAQIFDEISYGKGGSILRMIEAYAGESAFREGVRNHLKKNSFSNAVGNDLWTAIEKASGKDISTIMSSWIKTEGYPIVSASMVGNKIHLKQKKFRLDGSTDNTVWPIPLTIIRENVVRDTVLFNKKEMEIDAKGFMRLNDNHTGFYRVNYEGELLNAVLNHKDTMNSFDKWGILNDSFAALISGASDYETYMSIISRFTKDEEYAVINELVSELSELRIVLKHNEKIVSFGKDYLSYHRQRLGDRKHGEMDNISILRGRVNLALVHFDTNFARELSRKFDDYHNIDPNMRLAVSTSMALASNDANALVQSMKNQDNDEDRVKLIASMGWLKGDNNYNHIMELVKTQQIKKQDSRTFFVTASRNPENRSMIANDMDSLLALFRKYYGGTGYESRFVESVIPYVGLSNKAKIEDFVKRNKSPDIDQGLEKGIEELDILQKLNERIK